MAEELDGLEGIGDLDDEFGDQLDSFMDSEGGDDGELDSFFEDLSTIDDLEVRMMTSVLAVETLTTLVVRISKTNWNPLRRCCRRGWAAAATAASDDSPQPKLRKRRRKALVTKSLC